MKQYEAVIETLKRLGGIATLGQLNQEVFKIRDCEWNTKTPFASIRRIVQERKEIYKIKPGLWALTSCQKKLEANGFIIENEYNAEVINCGVGGENFQNILVRQGAFGFYLADDITIPRLSSEKVAIQTITNYITNEKFKNTWYGNESNFALLLQGETGRGSSNVKTVNPVIVRGVECTMTIDGTQQDATLYLNANKDMDEPLLVKEGTYLYLQGGRIKSDVSIFSIGTNDGWTVETDGEFDAN